MNLPTPSDHLPSSVKQSPIESGYSQGLSWYKNYCDLLPVSLHRGTKQTEKRTEARVNAIQSFEAILREVGPTQDQIMKIEASLRLIDLSPKRSEAAARYFYTAVELAELHIGPTWHEHEVGKMLFAMYETNIVSKKERKSLDRELGSASILIRNEVEITRIGAETKRRKQERMEIGTAPIQDAHIPLTAQQNIERLEYLFGPVRLAIIAEGDTIITSHRIAEGEALTLFSLSPRIHMSWIDLFGRRHTYRFIIDHGSDVGKHAFESDESMGIVHSLIGAHISAREEFSGREAREHDSLFREYTRTPSPPNHDYRHFIDEVLRLQTINRKLHIHSTSEEYLQAIAICGAITAHHREKSASTAEDLSQKIDTILGGRISRVVCDMVTSMLVAQHETMHGTGYPYGLMRGEISLEGKLYRVICAYKTLYWQNNGNQDQVILGLRKWSQGGNLDPDIVDIFIYSIPHISIGASPPQGDAITPYRAERLTPYQERWGELVGLMDDLRWRYDTLRLSQTHQAERKQILTTIDDTTQTIREAVSLEVHLMLRRHPITPSDLPGGPPGDKNEPLAPEGIQEAYKFGERLHGLAVEFYPSPLPRCEHAASLICQRINQCLPGCVCRHIQIEYALTNIDKYEEDRMPKSLLGHLLRSPSKGLAEFLLRIISSSHKSMHLIITHADILRIMLTIVNGIFAKDVYSGTRNRVGHDIIYEFLLRGGILVPWDRIFSTENWRNRLSTLTKLGKNVFGKAFQPPQDGVSLIVLHNRFCDYLDEMYESFPEKGARFLELLSQDTATADLPALLRKEKFGNE